MEKIDPKFKEDIQNRNVKVVTPISMTNSMTTGRPNICCIRSLSNRNTLFCSVVLVVFIGVMSLGTDILYILNVYHLKYGRSGVLNSDNIAKSQYGITPRWHPVYSKKAFEINHTDSPSSTVQNPHVTLTVTTSGNKTSLRIVRTLYPLTLDMPYLLSNLHLCRSVSSLSVLVIVHTAPDHTDRRNIMRKTWTNNTYFNDIGSLRILFLLGSTLDNITMKRIKEEFMTNGDILQGYFIDAYKNLTHKGVMGYKWISENCMNAHLIVKVDDDVMVDTYKLLSQYISSLSGRRHFVLCNYIKPDSMPIIRANNSKWYVAPDLFKGYSMYPQYCSGFGVIMSTDVVPSLYRAAFVTPFFWVDDVYLYGLLPTRVEGISYISLAGNFTLSYKEGFECFVKKSGGCPFLISGAGTPDEVTKLWNVMGMAHKRRT